MDVTLPGEERPLGTLHPSTLTRRVIEDAFLGLGYEVIDDREVETVHYNFDQLAFPPAHPTRSPRDTFFLDSGACSAQETSPSQIHVLEAKGPPIYMVSIGRVYGATRSRRPASRSSTSSRARGGPAHHPLGPQGTLLHVMRALFGEDRRVRFRTALPLHRAVIEPDVVPDLRHGGLPHVQVHGLGRARRRGDGRPTGLRQRRARPGGWTGFAFGCGIERAAQLATGSPRSRPFWENDLRVLRQF